MECNRFSVKGLILILEGLNGAFGSVKGIVGVVLVVLLVWHTHVILANYSQLNHTKGIHYFSL